MLGKKKGLQQDKLAEEKQEGLSAKKEEQIGEEEAKKEKKGKFGWLKNLLSPMKMLMGGLIKLVAPFLALGVLDWLSKPENLEKIKTLLKFFKGIWDLARWHTLGITVESSRDSLACADYPDEFTSGPKSYDSLEDHRVAMSLAPLSLRFPVTINDPSVVAKSYPEFWNHFTQL